MIAGSSSYRLVHISNILDSFRHQNLIVYVNKGFILTAKEKAKTKIKKFSYTNAAIP